MVAIMKWLYLCILAVLCAPLAYSQSHPIVSVDNIIVSHEEKGWRVISASTAPLHFNVIKGDLIVRIDGKNASETGPMQMANLLNQGDRRQIKLFIERGDFPMETVLRQISAQDYDPVGANPFRNVASGFTAPDVEFKDIDDQSITLEQFKGKWLLIDFMATWCSPCMDTLTSVLSVTDHNDLSLNLLLVALKDRVEVVRHMQQSYKISSPIAMMSAMAPLPIDLGITTNLWTGQIPSLVLIHPNGDVALIAIGDIDANHIEKTIECIMNCKADEILK